MKISKKGNIAIFEYEDSEGGFIVRLEEDENSPDYLEMKTTSRGDEITKTLILKDVRSEVPLGSFELSSKTLSPEDRYEKESSGGVSFKDVENDGIYLEIYFFEGSIYVLWDYDDVTVFKVKTGTPTEDWDYLKSLQK